MVSTVFLQFTRTFITTGWFVLFGLLVLLWSPPSPAMSVFLLVMALGCPAAVLVLRKHQPSPTVVHAVPRIDESRPAR